MRFRKTRRGVEVNADAGEAAVLRHCADQLLELLGAAEETPVDPIAAMVGLSPAGVSRPEDPALARLLPDAYGNDPEAAGEFRRYTEADLRAGKRAAARVVLAGLPAEGGKLLLDRDAADAWLGCLNDLRLVLGTRLEVTEETELDPLAASEDDPRAHALAVYGWLGWLQESLLGCLTPRR